MMITSSEGEILDLSIHCIPEPVEGGREDTDLLVYDNVSDKLGVL